MRRLLFVIVFTAMGMFKGHAQALVQTYTDRCTGQVFVFTVPMNGQTVVTFYNKSRTFTAAEFTNGTLRTWLEQTYTWWQTLSPCSTTTAATQTTQQTTTQATTNATNAATNATSNASSSATQSTGTTSTGTTSTGSTNTNSNGNTESNTNGNTSGTDSTSGDGNSSNGNSSGGTEESGGSSSEGGSTEKSTEETKTEEKTEEVKKEESKEESKDEKSDESKEKDSEEENNEEESDSSESEEDEEENSKEKEDDKDKKKKDKDRKKKNLTPPIVAANLVTMQMVDGVLTNALSFGYSQSSLTGEETYAVNTMIWSNLKQFSINLSQSTVFFNYDKEVPVFIIDPDTKKAYQFGSYNEKGTIMKIQSISLGYMQMFSTRIVTGGLSDVFIGQKDNFWKGFVGGYAITGMGVVLDKNQTVLTLALTAFGTKPFQVNSRLSLTPMLAYSMSPVTYDTSNGEIIYTPHGNYVVGNNFDFNLTQRFKANIGITSIGSTLPGIPLSWAVTIGSRFQF